MRILFDHGTPSARKISLLVITGSTKWTQVRLYVEGIADKLSEAVPGSYAEVFIPFEPKLARSMTNLKPYLASLGEGG